MKFQQTAIDDKANDDTDSKLKWYLSAFSVLVSALIVVILELQYAA